MDLRTDIPHAARVYDFVLGGKDNFEADRRAATAMMKASGPLLETSMRANRRFMARVAQHLAEVGFGQYLDIGTGLPTHPNLHEIVQRINPEADIVYVDNDPIVLVHARALLTPLENTGGSLTYLDADLADVDQIFEGLPFDPSVPVAVTMIAVLQLIDDDIAHRVINAVMDRLPSGSALAISAVCSEDDPEGIAQIVDVAQANKVPVRARTRGQIEELFDGLELDAVGVVPVHHWRRVPLEPELAFSEPVGMYGGLAYKR